jgi:hypothetical protein
VVKPKRLRPSSTSQFTTTLGSRHLARSTSILRKNVVQLSQEGKGKGLLSKYILHGNSQKQFTSLIRS